MYLDPIDHAVNQLCTKDLGHKHGNLIEAIMMTMPADLHIRSDGIVHKVKPEHYIL